MENKIIIATSIELFRNLTQYEYFDQHYDFHNNYVCERISYSDGILTISLKSLINGILLYLKFTETMIITFDYFNINDVDNLTIDNLYRGRCELNGNLIEVSKNGDGYFYLEFYEGQKLEFWANGISIE